MEILGGIASAILSDAGGSAFAASAVNFDGATLLSRGGALTGATGTYNTFLLSMWLKTGSSAQVIMGSAENGFMFASVNADNGGHNNLLFVNWYDPGFNGDVVGADYTMPGTPEWVNAIIAYDRTDQNKCKALLNGADVTRKAFFNVAAATLAGETDFHFGGQYGSPIYVGDVAEVYVAFGQWLDLTNAANVAKFISAGKPVDLGVDGALPTGTSPTILLGGDATAFATNRGTGGAFTVSAGALTNASTSPSD